MNDTNLVEEIGKFVVALFEQGYIECKKHYGLPIRYKPQHPELVEGKTDKEICYGIIARISQALISGESEELDREMRIVGRGFGTEFGRFRMRGDDSENPSGWLLQCRIQSFDDLYDQRIPVIAFSPSGSEEEE